MIRKKKTYGGPLIIDLTGPEGNAHVLLGFGKRLAAQLELDWKPIEEEMTSGDYENLIQVLDKHFGDYLILER